MELRSDQLIQRIVEQWMLEAEAVVFLILFYATKASVVMNSLQERLNPSLDWGGAAAAASHGSSHSPI